MAHRQEEKERRRRERLERERAEKAKIARRKRLQLALGALGAVTAVAVAVLLLSGTLGGDDAAGEGSPPEAANVQLPEQEIGDLREAAKAAGCTLRNPDIEGRTHETKQFKASDYKTNPPTSGNHAPTWYEDGVYEPGTTPDLGMLVHTLEHGRIDVQYKPGTPAETVRQLEAFLAEQNDGYHMLLFENASGMDAQIAATTWGHSLTCNEMNPQVFDALRTFRAEYIDQGPEQVP
ncbi:MAG TPA: DUF3105 domain-containing protein [Solirubrobacteraceae bacterium]|nr:DUF3105 domain-containing protein [Solirubrobacteraceae bacterium]